MVFVKAILSGMFSAGVGGLVAFAGLRWACFLLEAHGMGFEWGEAILTYLGTIACSVVGFTVGAVCSPLMPMASYLKGMVGGIGGLAGICGLISMVVWML